VAIPNREATEAWSETLHIAQAPVVHVGTVVVLAQSSVKRRSAQQQAPFSFLIEIHR
jgi:hypothetical protein